MLKFEFDSGKSLSNLQKHGIDFYSAQHLWNDSELLEVPVKTKDEKRYLVIAKYKGKHWSAVVTYRREVIRIISVRRSRISEVKLYESE